MVETAASYKSSSPPAVLQFFHAFCPRHIRLWGGYGVFSGRRDVQRARGLNSRAARRWQRGPFLQVDAEKAEVRERRSAGRLQLHVLNNAGAPSSPSCAPTARRAARRPPPAQMPAGLACSSAHLEVLVFPIPLLASGHPGSSVHVDRTAQLRL